MKASKIEPQLQSSKSEVLLFSSSSIFIVIDFYVGNEVYIINIY
jgi:hypothetical protein